MQRIIALRSCALSLEEIGTVLTAGGDSGLADLLRRQLAVVDERIRQAVSLRIRLLGILDGLDRMVEPSITEILRLIEETTTLNHPLSVEQFAALMEERARQVREMNAETFTARTEKLHQAWGCAGPRRAGPAGGAASCDAPRGRRRGELTRVEPHEVDKLRSADGSTRRASSESSTPTSAPWMRTSDPEADSACLSSVRADRGTHMLPDGPS